MPTHFLEKIDSWDIAANLEDAKTYFFPIQNFDKIEQGKISFIVGRKGTGKSMIAEYLEQESNDNFNVFTKLESLEAFPFELLYAADDSSYPNELRYITVWKYFIYLLIFNLLNRDESLSNIKSDFSDFIFEKQKNSFVESLNMGVNVFDVGGSFSITRKLLDKNINITEIVSKFEEALPKLKTKSVFYVIFDQLDDSFREMVNRENWEKFTSLIRGLFKACYDINTRFRKENIKIVPIVCARDDIYQLIEDDDKSKWSSLKLDLSWSNQQLKMMVRHRILKSIGSSLRRTNFSNVWRAVCSGRGIEMRQKRKSSFDYIIGTTLMRPRDVVKFIKLCAEEARANNNLTISSRNILAAERDFSNFLKEDIESEIAPLVPDIRYILDQLAFHGRKVMTLGEFREVYAHSQKQGENAGVINRAIKSYINPDAYSSDRINYIMNVLFWYGVIGNIPRRGKKIFKYSNPSSNYHLKQQICVHRGLYHSLGLK